MSNDKTKPSYYWTNGNDLIGFVSIMAPVEAFRWIMKFNVMKYVIRYENKNGIEDLMKAREYIYRLIRYEEEVGKNEYDK